MQFANCVFVEENLKSTALKDTCTTKLTGAVVRTDEPTTEEVPAVSNDLMSSAVKSRKRKAILLPDDYHSKLAVRKLENGKLELLL